MSNVDPVEMDVESAASSVDSSEDVFPPLNSLSSLEEEKSESSSEEYSSFSSSEDEESSLEEGGNKSLSEMVGSFFPELPEELRFSESITEKHFKVFKKENPKTKFTDTAVFRTRCRFTRIFLKLNGHPKFKEFQLDLSDSSNQRAKNFFKYVQREKKRDLFLEEEIRRGNSAKILHERYEAFLVRKSKPAGLGLVQFKRALSTYRALLIIPTEKPSAPKYDRRIGKKVKKIVRAGLNNGVDYDPRTLLEMAGFEPTKENTIRASYIKNEERSKYHGILPSIARRKDQSFQEMLADFLLTPSDKKKRSNSLTKKWKCHKNINNHHFKIFKKLHPKSDITFSLLFKRQFNYARKFLKLDENPDFNKFELNWSTSANKKVEGFFDYVRHQTTDKELLHKDENTKKEKDKLYKKYKKFLKDAGRKESTQSLNLFKQMLSVYKALFTRTAEEELFENSSTTDSEEDEAREVSSKKRKREDLEREGEQASNDNRTSPPEAKRHKITSKKGERRASIAKKRRRIL